MSADPRVAMTPQQRKFAEEAHTGLSTYKHVIVGDKSWLTFFFFELYRLFVQQMNSVLGIALRRLYLPLFFHRCGSGLVVGQGVTVREPGRISIGKKVVIDDLASIDVRSRPGKDVEAFVEIGDYVYIGRQSVVSAKHGKIRLAAAVNIGSNARIATRETIDIGESVLIASYVYIGAGNHRSDDLARPVMEQDMEYKGGVTIGANSWIGTRATICDGVTIGKDCIVGAHSLVRENVPDRAIVAGTPAKIIRFRE